MSTNRVLIIIIILVIFGAVVIIQQQQHFDQVERIEFDIIHKMMAEELKRTKEQVISEGQFKKQVNEVIQKDAAE